MDKKYYLTCTPPGVVKISDNFYCDETEVTNVNYREYMFWTRRVFGDSSNEYQSVIPDTLVWWNDTVVSHRVRCIKYPLYDYYLRGVSSMDNPVVGITWDQAVDFCKWRSDRVMEFLLVKNNEIKWDANPTADTYFSIERYYEGKYKGIKPNPRFSYYPLFRLPTIAEWKKAVEYDDSITNVKSDKTNTKLWLNIYPCVGDSQYCSPTKSETGSYSPKKGAPIYNLLDNVREWTAEKDTCVGGSWFDKEDIISKQDTAFHTVYPNAYTGFRNIVSWKKWGDK